MSSIPQTDSIAELARFWDAHDLSELEGELEEARTPVFEPRSKNVLRVTLPAEVAAAQPRAAQSRSAGDTELVREWLSEKLHAV